jgi:hypothetical protein
MQFQHLTLKPDRVKLEGGTFQLRPLLGFRMADPLFALLQLLGAAEFGKAGFFEVGP